MNDSKERESACDGNVEIPVSGSKISGVDTLVDSSVSHINDTTSARGLSVDHSPAPLPPSLTASSSVTASGSGVEEETQDMSGSLLECLNLSLEEIRAHRVCIGRGGIKRSRPDSRISDSTCDLSSGNAKTGAVKRKKKVRTVSSLSADRDVEGGGVAVPQPDSTFDFQSSHAEEQEYALKRHADTYDGEEMEVEAEVEEDSADEDNDGDGEGDGCVVVSPSSQHHLDSPSESDMMSQRRARAMMLASRLASSSLSLSLPLSASPSLKDSRMERGEGMGVGVERYDCHEVSCTDDSSSVATLINVAGEREECDTFPHDHACSNKVGERGGAGGGEDDKVRDIGEDADDPLRYREDDMSERRESGSVDGDRTKMSSSELHTAVTENSGIQGSKSSSEHSNKNANGREKDRDRDGDGKPRYVYRESKYILSK